MTITVIDTSGFFAASGDLKGIITQQEDSLHTLDLVIFEFLKVIEQESNRAKGKGNFKRARVLQSLAERFPVLLRELDIGIRTGDEITLEDVDQILFLVSKGHEAGDSMIWVKMQKLGFKTILTDDTGHWRSLGASVLPISHAMSV